MKTSMLLRLVFGLILLASLSGVAMGVVGFKAESEDNDGLVGIAKVSGKSGVFGYNPTAGGNGVAGISENGNGLYGSSKTLNGIYGQSETGSGVHGHSKDQIGVFGISEKGDGIAGNTKASGKSGVFGYNPTAGGNGVAGISENGNGLYGSSKTLNGIYGQSETGSGVHGHSKDQIGVFGISEKGDGIAGNTKASGKSGVFGRNDGGGYGVAGFSETGIGVYGRNSIKVSPALSVGVKGEGEGYGVMGIGSSGVYARGNRVGVEIDGHSGDLIVGYRPQSGSTAFENVFRVDNAGAVFANGGFHSAGADLAESITSCDSLHLGDVVEIDPNHPGQFRMATTPNGTAVAGVISTNPGVTLGAKNVAGSTANTEPQLALAGRVPVKVSAENGAILPGDLLVASSTPGHAMRATANPVPGTVIGKALGRLDKGTGVIKMLVMLR